MIPFIKLSIRTEGTDVTTPVVLATGGIISLELVKIKGPPRCGQRDATKITTSLMQTFVVSEDIDDIGNTILERK